MMEFVIWSELDALERKAVLARPGTHAERKLLDCVRGIVEDVRTRGWPAVEHYSKWIDGTEPGLIEVAPIAERARRELDPAFVEALELARRNIEHFHLATRPRDVEVETAPGLKVAKVWRAVDHAGIYVPGGSAPLFSSLLMLAIPARVAGVGKLTLVTPPREGLHPGIALAAEMCGIGEVWALGGAQAIAALAFGAGEIEPAQLICGPGNAYVAAAKALVSSIPGGPRIDLPAGPSELMVIADGSADPELVAADLLSQAEHDPSAQVLLITTSPSLAAEAREEVERQLVSLPRADIARAALAHARTILVDAMEEALSIANSYAPEHLSLAVGKPKAFLPGIRNAGAVFAGAQAAETFGDYLAGSSHVLPTDGAARAWGGVSTSTFMKAMTVQEMGSPAASGLARAAALLARAEGLEAHARAANVRGRQAA
jgi:histidinol dehydrogenase